MSEREGEAMNVSDTKASALPEGILSPDGHSATLPPGRYFLGDPGYPASDEEAWGDWVDLSAESSNDFGLPLSGASINGHPIVAASTEFGDGLFMDQNGTEFSVDSGCIGLVPQEYLDGIEVDLDSLNKLGVMVDFTSEVTISFKDGVISVVDKAHQFYIDTAE